MRLYILFILTLATICIAPRPNQAQTQTKPPTNSEVIARSVRLTDAKRFKEAQLSLEARLVKAKTKSEREKLQNALADVHFSWARHLETKYEYNEAIKHYLAAYETDKVWRRGNAGVHLSNVGAAYDSLNEYEKALQFYKDALLIGREVKDRSGESTTLNNIGSVYDSLSQYEKALQFYNRALLIRREVKDKSGEAITLNNIGSVYNSLSQYEKALQFYNQALPIQREIKDRTGEAKILSNIGSVYNSLSQYEKALQFYNQALPILREVKDRSTEAKTLTNVMLVLSRQNQPFTAIFYGKRAVNLHQSIRRDNAGLNKESKDAYLKGNENTYRTLARLLIEAGRFAEADEVLAMVQREEFLDFVRRDTRGIRMESAAASYVGEEKTVLDEQTQILDNFVALWQERKTLAALKSPTEVQKRRLNAIEAALKKQQEKLDAFFAAMPTRFARNVEDVNKDREMIKPIQSLLRDMGGNIAHVWAFMDDQGVELLITKTSGPTINLSFKPDEKALDGKGFRAWLNPKIKAFNEATIKLQSAEALSRELYNVVFCRGELEAQLKESGIDTILWRMTGSLSEIPISALRGRDGYVVEKYGSVLLTAGSSDINLGHKPVRNWRALGLGVTKARTIGADSFRALDGVDGELRSLVDAPEDGFKGGLLPGRVLRDEKFTADSFLAALQGPNPDDVSPYQLVHIASHFKLAGDSLQSYLLTGETKPLTIADLQERGKDTPLFSGVELMTLSACQTGSAGNSNANSLGTLAEINGAKAVIATLWPVADSETSQLMSDFYRLHRDNPTKSKAWSLRQAQLGLLKRNGKAAHPYYWAPFVLMGNSR